MLPIPSLTIPREAPSTALALLITLVVYPAVYCSGFMGQLVKPIIVEGSRPHWWAFWLVNLVFHAVGFAAVALALRGSDRWKSIGLNWRWFLDQKYWMMIVLALLLAGAVLLPGFYYAEGVPSRSGTHFLGPISIFERLFVIVAAAAVAISEEIILRGFALNELNRRMAWPLAVLASGISFVFIHGTPRSVEFFATYFMASLFFAIPFVAMKYRRLELLVLIHFLIDASLAIAP